MFRGNRLHEFDHQALVSMTDYRAGRTGRPQPGTVPQLLVAGALGAHQVVFGEDEAGPWAACDQCDWREHYPDARQRDQQARWHAADVYFRDQQRPARSTRRRRWG